MGFTFKVFRDCDATLGPLPRLRKIVIECYKDGVLVIRARMFGCLFKKRLERKLARQKAHILELAQILAG